MAKNFIDVIIILDKSGSMEELTDDTIGGYNSLIQKQKDENKDMNVFVSTYLFNDRVSTLCDAQAITKVEPLTRKNYFASGSTALYDAIGYAITREDERVVKLARSQKPLPQKTLIVVTTDGYENASIKYRYEEIRKLIGQKKEEGVSFLFIGANIDSDTFAEHIGIGSDYAFTVQNNSLGVRNMMDGIQASMVMCCKYEDREITNQKIKEMVAKKKGKN